VLRSDYAYRPLSESQYEAIITGGEIFHDASGNIIRSPLHGHDCYVAAEAQAKAGDVDLRVLLAATHFEDHHGTDPAGGTELAKVYNFGGIKWAHQPGAFDSGIPYPRNEGIGNYAGFRDFGGFIAELIRTLNNQYIGDAFRAGDLARAWGIYIGGPNNPNVSGGTARVDQWQYYLKKYPSEGERTVADGIYGEDLIAKLETRIGHTLSGDYDMRNGHNHPWAYYCRAAVESTGRNCGLSVVARPSALAAQHAAASQGLLNTTDPPEHGAVVQFDTQFYAPDGHTGFWNADKGQLLGTLTDGTGIGYKVWGMQTPGYAGWYRLPGIVNARRPVTSAPPFESGTLVIPDNPYNTDPKNQLGVGGAFRRVWELLPTPLALLGYPMSNERSATVTDSDNTSRTRTVQQFERVTLIYQPELPSPWNAVAALHNQKITLL
jgi:hypothetical protein